MELGAVDCIGTPSIDHPNSFDDLPARVRAAAGARLQRPSLGRPGAVDELATYKPDGRIVAIGASTGGVEALISVIAGYPENCPPTVMTVHMPSPFTRSFARRLDGLTDAHVAEAEDGAPIEVGRVYVAPGTLTHLEVSGGTRPTCRLSASEQVNGHRPSVDVMFESTAKAFGARALGVILTGMGRDGAAGLMAMRRSGARTLGQDEGSSVVYGMPKVAFEIGAVERQLPIGEMRAGILKLTSSGKN
jgi:two-component system chemotaxis response regulator CheB